MEIPCIDFSKPENIVKEIFDDDRWVKDEFNKYFAAEILDFSNSLSPSLPLLSALNDEVGSNVQTALVCGIIHGVIDDLMVSMKLLVTGKLMASGNLMRQAIEGLCIAIMCAANTPLAIHGESLIYWKCIEGMDFRVMGHKAVKHLEKNQEVLDVSKDAITKLKRAQVRYHQFSHAGPFGIATRVGLGEVGQAFIGGSFDKAKLNAYRIEILERIGFCKLLPSVIQTLMKQYQQE